MRTRPPVAIVPATARRRSRRVLSPLLLAAALLAAGPAQALTLDMLLRMPLERLLQLEFRPARAALGEATRAPGAGHAR